MTNYIERYWRDATPADAIKDPPMVARFRNGEGYNWFIGPLMGIRRDNNYPWYSTNIGSFEQCQVYDAPDPGEGWRLIDTEKETPKNGDEFLLTTRNEWITIVEHPSRKGFAENYIYRRRIEPPKPKYEPFRWEDREQLRGRWLQRKTDSIPIEQIATKFETGRRGLIVNGIYGADLLLKQWTFLDTGEPVGRRVE